MDKEMLILRAKLYCDTYLAWTLETINNPNVAKRKAERAVSDFDDQFKQTD